MSKRIAIFASGAGSNAQRIIEYFQKNGGASVVLVLCNKAKALVLSRAKELHVETFVFNKEALTSGSTVLGKLAEHRVDLVVLSGFLLKVPASIVRAYPNRIINVHPALLPKFGGKGMYGMRVHQAVVAAEEKESGITIHYVNEHYDDGAVIFQAKCPVNPNESAEELAKKIQALEHKHFAETINELIETL